MSDYGDEEKGIANLGDRDLDKMRKRQVQFSKERANAKERMNKAIEKQDLQSDKARNKTWSSNHKDNKTEDKNRTFPPDNVTDDRKKFNGSSYLNLTLAAIYLICIGLYFGLGFGLLSGGQDWSSFQMGPIAGKDPNGTLDGTITYTLTRVYNFYYLNYLGVPAVMAFIFVFSEFIISRMGRWWDMYIYDWIARGCNHLLWWNQIIVFPWLNMEILYAMGETDAMKQLLNFMANVGIFSLWYGFQYYNCPEKMGAAGFNKMVDHDKEEKQDDDGYVTVKETDSRPAAKRMPLMVWPCGEFVPGWHLDWWELKWTNAVMALIIWAGQFSYFVTVYVFASPEKEVTAVFALWIVFEIFFVLINLLYAGRVMQMSHYLNFNIASQINLLLTLVVLGMTLSGPSWNRRSEV